MVRIHEIYQLKTLSLPFTLNSSYWRPDHLHKCHYLAGLPSILVFTYLYLGFKRRLLHHQLQTPVLGFTFLKTLLNQNWLKLYLWNSYSRIEQTKNKKNSWKQRGLKIGMLIQKIFRPIMPCLKNEDRKLLSARQKQFCIPSQRLILVRLFSLIFRFIGRGAYFQYLP